MSLEKIRVNIVEEPGWKPYDPGGEIMEWASNSSYEDFRHMSKVDMIELVEDMFGRAKTGPLEWSPRKFALSEEDCDIIWEELKEGGLTGKLETTWQSILDAMQWTWEEAYTPDNGDIRDAMERAAEAVADEYNLDTSPWEPLLERTGWDERKILESLMGKVSYEREENHYDRFIVFDFGAAEAVKKLLKIVYADPEELSEKETLDQLKMDFEGLRDGYVDLFFGKLEKIMRETDASNRTEFRKHWKSMLSDKAQMNHVGEEIRKFVLKARAQVGEE